MINAEPQELRCNACGAALHYEEGVAVITCAHCGTEYVLDVPTEGFIEFSFEEAGEDEIPDVEAPAAVEPSAAPAYEAEVLALLRAGQLIQAVKVVRAHTGLGLREAKEHAEALAAREGVDIPAARNKACLVIVVATLALAAAGVVSFLILTR
jgi:LSD1 subclass zinc finger protein